MLVNFLATTSEGASSYAHVVAVSVYRGQAVLDKDNESARCGTRLGYSHEA